MKLHTAKYKQKQFARFKTESSSWKIPNFRVAAFWIISIVPRTQVSPYLDFKETLEKYRGHVQNTR